MADSCIERLASVLVGYSANVQPGELVTIEGPLVATPLIVEIYREVLRAGGNPLPKLKLPRLFEILFAEASDAQLDWVDPRVSRDQRDGGREDHRRRRDEHEEPLERCARPPGPPQPGARGLAEPLSQRAAAGELKWVLTAFPTEAGAQDAEMSLREYEQFVYGAGSCRAGSGRVVAGVRGARVRGEGYLEGIRELRIVAEGTDLTLGVDGPDVGALGGAGELPGRRGLHGADRVPGRRDVRFTYPAGYQGREVHDVELRFEGGEVVGSSASHGLEFLRAMIGMDEGVRRLGEFAFGLNEGIDRFTRNILFDEKIGGTVHLALGTGIRDRWSQPLRAALGLDLRPPLGQRGLRRRRGRLPRRPVPAGRVVAVDVAGPGTDMSGVGREGSWPRHVRIGRGSGMPRRWA